MEKKKSLTPAIIEILRRPFPAELLESIGKGLTSIKAIYVAERLNEAFGIGKWENPHEIVFQNEQTIIIRGRLEIPEFGIVTPYQYGGGEVRGKATNLIEAHKGAGTDMIGKCASYLEIGIDVFKGKGFEAAKTEQPANGKAVDPSNFEWKKISGNLDEAKLRAAKWNGTVQESPAGRKFITTENNGKQYGIVLTKAQFTQLSKSTSHAK